MRTRTVILASVILGAAVCALWLSRTPDAAQPDLNSHSMEVDAQPNVGSSRDANVELKSGDASDQNASGRIDVKSVRAVRGVVLDEAGRPVPAAEVSWTPLLDAFEFATSENVAEIAASTISSSTDAQGIFVLEAAADISAVPEAIALWTTKSGFCAELHVLEKDSKLPASVEVRLKSAAPARFIVRGAHDVPVPAARVELFGTVPRALESSLTNSVRRARRILHRTLTTNERGTADAFTCADDCEVAASLGDLESAPHTSPIEGDLVLRLVSAFTFEGRVDLDAGAKLSVDTAVAAGPVTEWDFDWIAHSRVRADGTFGPTSCPIVEGDNFAFMLSGGNLVATSERRAPPRPGEHVVVNFRGERGREIALHVADEKHIDVEGAAAQAFWAGTVSSIERSSAQLLTDAQGRVRLPVLASGSITLAVKKRGFAPARWGPMVLKGEADEPVEVALHHGGTIEGRVVHGAQPVEAFQVFYWPKDLAQFRMREFAGRRDGRFRIEDVEPVEHLLYAASTEWPQSEIQVASFSNGVAGPITFDLPESRVGHGRVIDGETRRPVADATVDVWNTWNYQLMSQQGETARVDANGEFRVSGLHAGRNVLWIRAPGYEWLQPNAIAATDGETDFGIAALFRGVDVDFRLTSSAPEDFSKFTLSVRYVKSMDPTFLPRDGHFVIDQCRAGVISLGVGYPDDSTVWLRRTIRTERERSIVHDVPNAVSLALRLRDSGGAVQGDLAGTIAYRSREGDELVREIPVVEGKPSELSRLPTGPAIVELHDGSGLIARQRVDLGPAGAHQEVELVPNRRERTLRFVDANGKPHASEEFAWRCADADFSFNDWGTTDADGRVTVPETDCHRIVASLTGARPRCGMLVELDGDASRELLVDTGPDATLAVRLHDRDATLDGVRVWMREPASKIDFGAKATDRFGVARWDDIRACTYEVIVEGQNLWRSVRSFDAKPDASTGDFDLRRTGHAKFTVLGSLGAPLEGVAVDLISSEFTVSAAQWVEQGLVSRSSAGTDVNGSVRFDGLPNGDYSWTAVLPDGRRLTGTTTIPPWSESSVDVNAN